MSELERFQEQMNEAIVQIARNWEAPIQAMCQALAPFLPKQKIVDRRRLAARRAKRRNERKDV